MNLQSCFFISGPASLYMHLLHLSSYDGQYVRLDTPNATPLNKEVINGPDILFYPEICGRL